MNWIERTSGCVYIFPILKPNRNANKLKNKIHEFTYFRKRNSIDFFSRKIDFTNKRFVRIWNVHVVCHFWFFYRIPYVLMFVINRYSLFTENVLNIFFFFLYTVWSWKKKNTNNTYTMRTTMLILPTRCLFRMCTTCPEGGEKNNNYCDDN